MLVALTREPALEGVKAELDLTWRVQRVRLPDGDLAIVSPLDRRRRGVRGRARVRPRALAPRRALSAVGEGRAWEALVEREAERHPGVQVERLTPSRALPELMDAPDRLLRDRHAAAFARGRLRPRRGAAQRTTRIVASGPAVRRPGPACSGRRTARRPTSPGRASPTRAGCCSPPR